MPIDLTIKSGTTRTYPQEGDSDLFGTATNWAQDVTNAINNAPTYAEMDQYDAIVGTAANVTAGIATHSDIATAITSLAAGDRMYLLNTTFEPAAMIDINKTLTIVGSGELAIISGVNIATGAVVKLNANGITLENIKIIQGAGTPDYAVEIAAGVERCHLNVKADGTFATSLYLNGTVAGATTGTITYDTNSVTLLGESIEVEQIKIEDQTTPAQNLNIESDSDTDILTADRTLTIDVHDGDRTLDLSENLTVGNGFDITLTAEDAASSIVLDEQSFEVEGEGTATRLTKIVNAEDAARTLTFHEDLTIGDGAAVTITAEDAAGSIVLDEQSFEVEGEGTASRLTKIVNAEDAARTLTFHEDLTIADGNDVSITAEDNNTSVVMDNANFEVENTDGTQRNIKITSAKAGDTTLTLEENLTVGDGYDVTVTAEDAAGAIVLDNCGLEVEDTIGSGNNIKFVIGTNDASRTVTLSENLVVGDGADVTLIAEDAAGSVTLDNCSLEVEDTIGSGNTVKFIIGTDDASRTVTLSENLVIGDGYDVTLIAEDAAGSITLDEQTFEVEGEGTASQLTKIVNANNAAATLTLEGTASVIDQDVTADADVSFNSVECVVDIDTPLVTNDSADVTISTTTSGDVNLNSVDETVRISSASATNATANQILFGDDTGGVTGIRNNSGSIEYQLLGGGWVALTGALAANVALDNLAGVAINTSLISDTDSTDDLGSTSKKWKELHVDQINIDNGATILPGNRVLESDYFSSLTNVEAHHLNSLVLDATALVAWNGGNNLDDTAGMLGTMTSPLGQALTYCNFDGSTYLSNATITVGNNHDFTWSGWVYFADWAAATTEVIASENDGSTGFTINKVSGNLYLYKYDTPAATEITISCANFSAGWHHVIFSRSHGNYSMIMIDGVVKAYNNTAAAITAAGDYELGSQNGGNNKMTGGLWDVALDTANAYDANACRKLYAAACSANGSIGTEVNGEVKIDGKQPVCIHVYPTASATIADGSEPANYTGFSLFTPENGDYEITFVGTLDIDDEDDSGTVTAAIGVYDNTNGAIYNGMVQYSAFLSRDTSAASDMEDFNPINITNNHYLTKDDNLTVRLISISAGDSTSIIYSNNSYEPFMRIKKDM